MEIVAVPAFADNYIWLVHDGDSGETAVVDPGDAAPALAEAERRGWTITQVWNTHHHWDHTGGNPAIKDATGCTISGPAARHHGRDVALAEGSEFSSPPLRRVMKSRAHARPHRARVRIRASPLRGHVFAMGAGAVRRHAQQMTARSSASGAAGRTALYCGTNIRWRTRASRRTPSPTIPRPPSDWRTSKSCARGEESPCRRPSHRNGRPIPSFGLVIGRNSLGCALKKTGFVHEAAMPPGA